MSGKAVIIPAKIVWGYTEIPKAGKNKIVELGTAQIETGRSLASLRTRATRLVKADANMQLFLLSHLPDDNQLHLYKHENGVARGLEVDLWEHEYYPREEWEKWQAPSHSEKHPAIMITSRRKWIFKPYWIYHSGVHGIGNSSPEKANTPAIQAYYACGYEGTLQ